MKTDVGVIAGLVLMVIASNADALGEERPDLSKPEVLQKILGEAVVGDTLKKRGPKGAKLYYPPDSKSPYNC